MAENLDEPTKFTNAALRQEKKWQKNERSFSAKLFVYIPLQKKICTKI